MNPMQLDQLLLGLIALILAANVAVVTGTSRRIRDRWRSVDPFGRRAGGSSPARQGDGRSDSPAVLLPRARTARGNDAQTAAAIEAFVAGDDGGVGRDVATGLRRPGPLIPEPDRAASSAGAVEAGEFPESAAPFDEAPSLVLHRLLQDEGARVARFGRPVTVAYVECPDLDVLADRLGELAAERIAAETARILHDHMRETDRIVRLGRARFALLLIETDELDAHLFAKRVRTATDEWFASTRLSARLAIGLASPDQGRDLEEAAASARERMAAAGRRPAEGGAEEPSRTARTAPAGGDDLARIGSRSRVRRS